MFDSANNTKDAKNSSHTNNGALNQLPTTDDRVRIHLRDGSLIEGETDGDARVTHVGDRGAVTIRLKPASNHDAHVNHVHINIISMEGDDPLILAQTWWEAGNKTPTTEPVDEITVLNDK